ncbi:MAG: hypothetical protein RRA92_07130 [Gemmatimonadota bacterium]|nr:hypothetical protein [Gemmatimonadota bacterium]
MAPLTRHQIGASLLAAFRAEGLGVRDLFEGRQEPITWFFRCLAYDQSELDILESGALEMLHAPSALVELSIDEVALAGAVIGAEGIAGYLADEAFEDQEPPGEGEGVPGGPPPDLPPVAFHADITLGTLTLDVAPPTLWLEERPADPEANETLARRLGFMAQDVGRSADAVEVHIEGALDASEEGWADQAARVRPAGVSVHFTFDIPLLEADERRLARTFEQGAATTARALEAIRRVFERAG